MARSRSKREREERQHSDRHPEGVSEFQHQTSFGHLARNGGLPPAESWNLPRPHQSGRSASASLPRRDSPPRAGLESRPENSGGTSAAAGRVRQLSERYGAEFDGLFLELMIQHHEGALVMVGELHAGGGGVEPESFSFSAHIEADQEIEIRRMRELLAELDAG
ncbi:MAG: DUF305 domain-containing protein [Gaiellaceae bacterium]